MPTHPTGDWKIDSLSNRFCYWQSEEGTRYLFTQIGLEDLTSFSDCVVLVAFDNDTRPQVHWVGEIAELSPLAFQAMDPDDIENAGLYVHLLAGSADARKQVIRDLSREAGKEALRLCA